MSPGHQQPSPADAGAEVPTAITARPAAPLRRSALLTTTAAALLWLPPAAALRGRWRARRAVTAGRQKRNSHTNRREPSRREGFSMSPLLRMLALFRRAHPATFPGGLGLMRTTLAGRAPLLGLSGWFIAACAAAGSAGVRLLALERAAAPVSRAGPRRERRSARCAGRRRWTASRRSSRRSTGCIRASQPHRWRWRRSSWCSTRSGWRAARTRRAGARSAAEPCRAPRCADRASGQDVEQGWHGG